MRTTFPPATGTNTGTNTGTSIGSDRRTGNDRAAGQAGEIRQWRTEGPAEPAPPTGDGQTGDDLGEIFGDASRRLPDPIGASDAWMLEPVGSPSNASDISTTSVKSSFADRPGFMNPPDTLSFSVPDNSRLTMQIFAEMVNLAVEKKFDLNVNVRSNFLSKMEGLLGRIGIPRVDVRADPKFVPYEIAVFHSDRQNVTITLNAQAVAPPSWPEDTMFISQNSLHRLADEFSGPLGPDNGKAKDAIIKHRIETYDRLGIPDPDSFARALMTGGSHHEIDAVPAEMKTYSRRSGEPSLRSLPQRKSIAAAIEGGNILGNAAEPGRQKFLVGRDSVALTLAHMKRHNEQATYEEAKERIIKELHLTGADAVTFLNQTSYHIDMTMNFCGENEVVLNDSKAYFDMRKSSFAEGRGTVALNVTMEELEQNANSFSKVEQSVQKELEADGFTVHRKPWASEDHLTTLFNIETVKTHENKNIVLATDFYQKDNSAAISQQDIAAIKADFVLFYARRGFDVEFMSSGLAETLLTAHGGIGCKVNGMRS